MFLYLEQGSKKMQKCEHQNTTVEKQMLGVKKPLLPDIFVEADRQKKTPPPQKIATQLGEVPARTVQAVSQESLRHVYVCCASSPSPTNDALVIFCIRRSLLRIFCRFQPVENKNVEKGKRREGVQHYYKKAPVELAFSRLRSKTYLSAIIWHAVVQMLVAMVATRSICASFRFSLRRKKNPTRVRIH